jgi:hypothetical protein
MGAVSMWRTALFNGQKQRFPFSDATMHDSRFRIAFGHTIDRGNGAGHPAVFKTDGLV